MSATIKRVLSIDGGGIKGVFPASFLASVEDSVGESVAKYFDLIVGTSTGGIIALGLGLGFSATEILGFYEQLGPRIFHGGRVRRTLASLKQLGFAKYSHRELEQALSELFGDRKLGESSRRLVIPSLNLETGEVYIYKTAHHPRFETDYKVNAVHVALATASAPSFFPTYRSAVGTPLIDGGVWANNPAGLAAVEALGVLGWTPEQTRMLSLGCTTQPFGVSLARHLPLGLSYWGFKVTEMFMTAQSSASIGTAKILLGPDNFLRVSPMVARSRFGLDKVAEIGSLKGLGASEARIVLPLLKERFLYALSDEFNPYHSL